MSRHVVALTGVSGVGKTAFLRELATRLTFLPLQASALIREGRQAAEGGSVSLDQLRDVNLDQNQQFLIDGFHLATNSIAALIVLDGHSLIERDDNLLRIDPGVFAAVGTGCMIFLMDDPTAILARRLGDSKRRRPAKDAKELGEVQEAALGHAETICRCLNVVLKILRPSQLDEAIDFLRPYESS